MEGRSDATSLPLTTSPLACPIGEDNTGRANLPPISIRCDVTVPRRTKGEARLLVLGRGIPGNKENNLVLISYLRDANKPSDRDPTDTNPLQDWEWKGRVLPHRVWRALRRLQESTGDDYWGR